VWAYNSEQARLKEKVKNFKGVKERSRVPRVRKKRGETKRTHGEEEKKLGKKNPGKKSQDST